MYFIYLVIFFIPCTPILALFLDDETIFNGEGFNPMNEPSESYLEKNVLPSIFSPGSVGTFDPVAAEREFSCLMIRS